MRRVSDAAGDLPRTQKRHKPQAEYWAHPQLGPPRPKEAARAAPGKPPGGKEGPQPGQHPGHLVHDRRKRSAGRGDDSERLLFMEAIEDLR